VAQYIVLEVNHNFLMMGVIVEQCCISLSEIVQEMEVVEAVEVEVYSFAVIQNEKLSLYK
jgi:hypothetical protein